MRVEGGRMTWIKRIFTDMNTDERRYIHVTEFAAQSNGSTHRKVRKERKAEGQKSVHSLRLIEFHGIPMAQGNKEMIVFQTGVKLLVTEFEDGLIQMIEWYRNNNGVASF